MDIDERLRRIEEVIAEVLRRLPASTAAQMKREAYKGQQDEMFQIVKKYTEGLTDVSVPEICEKIRLETGKEADQGDKMGVSRAFRLLGYVKYRQSRRQSGPTGVQKERWKLSIQPVAMIRTLVKRRPPTCKPCKAGSHAECWKDARKDWTFAFVCRCEECGGSGYKEDMPRVVG